MITLTNLTALQRELCDHIWSIDDHDQLRAWMQALPPGVRATAQALVDVMIMEYLDQQEITDLSDAEAIIERIQHGNSL